MARSNVQIPSPLTKRLTKRNVAVRESTDKEKKRLINGGHILSPNEIECRSAALRLTMTLDQRMADSAVVAMLAEEAATGLGCRPKMRRCGKSRGTSCDSQEKGNDRSLAQQKESGKMRRNFSSLRDGV
jgi:hypothetical protein